MRSTDSPTELYQGVAAEVRAEMARQRLSQGRIAAQMGVSQAAVSRRIIGEVPFDLQDLSKVADILKVSTVELIERAARAESRASAA
jgi:predicted transcriptional regulator